MTAPDPRDGDPLTVLEHGFSPRPLWAGTCTWCGAKAGESCAVLYHRPSLPRFREQRRRSRWGCGVVVLVLVGFWVAFLMVVLALAAVLDSNRHDAGLQMTISHAAPRGAPDSEGSQALLGAPRAWVAQLAERRVRDSLDAEGAGSNPVLGGQRASGAPLPAAASTQPATAISHGVASWYAARGDQGAVPWWRPGQDPVWAVVCRFADSRSRCVTILITGWCQCLVGQPGERLIDLSDGAFAQLAPLSVGLIEVTLEVGTAGPGLPATDGSE